MNKVNSLGIEPPASLKQEPKDWKFKTAYKEWDMVMSGQDQLYTCAVSTQCGKISPTSKKN